MNATIERRRLISGAAWSLPAIALATPAPAMAASCPPLDVVLDWSSNYVRSSNTFGSWTSDPDGTGPVEPVTVTVSSTFVGQMTPTTTSGLVNLGVTTGGVGGTPLPGLILLQDLVGTPVDNTRTSRQDVVFTFSRPVDDLAFSVTDLDASPAYLDALQFISPTSFTPTLGSSVAGGGTATNPWRATGGIIENDRPEGNVNITMTAPVSSFAFSYWNLRSQGGLQGVFVSSMTFRVAGDCTGPGA